MPKRSELSDLLTNANLVSSYQQYGPISNRCPVEKLQNETGFLGFLLSLCSSVSFIVQKSSKLLEFHKCSAEFPVTRIIERFLPRSPGISYQVVTVCQLFPHIVNSNEQHSAESVGNFTPFLQFH